MNNLDPEFEKQLSEELMARYGLLVGGKDLQMALGYPSNAAFRQSIARKTTPIPVFRIENRKGKFALTKDLAAWLSARRHSALTDHTTRATD